MQHPGRVFSREQLLDAVWGSDVYVEARTVDVHIGRLRKALNGDVDGDPIRTVRSAGYSLDWTRPRDGPILGSPGLSPRRSAFVRSSNRAFDLGAGAGRGRRASPGPARWSSSRRPSGWVTHGDMRDPVVLRQSLIA